MERRKGKFVETSISHLNVCFPAPLGTGHVGREAQDMFRLKPVPARKPQQREKANNIFYIILLQQKITSIFQC